MVRLYDYIIYRPYAVIERPKPSGRERDEQTKEQINFAMRHLALLPLFLSYSSLLAIRFILSTCCRSTVVVAVDNVQSSQQSR